MTLPNFEIAKREARINRKFPTWNAWLAWAERIETSRRAAIRARSHDLKVTPYLDSLFRLRIDYFRWPQRFFSNKAEQQKEIHDLDHEIRSMGGADKLNAMLTVELNAIVSTMKQTAEYRHKIAKIFAGKTIGNWLIRTHIPKNKVKIGPPPKRWVLPHNPLVSHYQTCWKCQEKAIGVYKTPLYGVYSVTPCYACHYDSYA